MKRIGIPVKKGTGYTYAVTQDPFLKSQCNGKCGYMMEASVHCPDQLCSKCRWGPPLRYDPRNKQRYIKKKELEVEEQWDPDEFFFLHATQDPYTQGVAKNMKEEEVEKTYEYPDIIARPGYCAKMRVNGLKKMVMKHALQSVLRENCHLRQDFRGMNEFLADHFDTYTKTCGVKEIYGEMSTFFF